MKHYFLVFVFFYLSLLFLEYGGGSMQKGISLKVFLMVISVLALLEIVILIILRPQNSLYNGEYCQEAICNEDASICYQYDLDENGETKIIWRGSCQK